MRKRNELERLSALSVADQADTAKKATLVEDKISIQEVRLFAALQQHPKQWLTIAELANAAAICPRTARAHLPRLVALGVADGVRLHPAHKYRLADPVGPMAANYLVRVRHAREVFGV